MAWDYSEKVKKLFFDAINKKASSHIGEIDNPDGEGFHGSLVCGDAIKLSFKVEKNKDPKKDIITKIKYLTFGCTSAIAASEAICIMIEQGKYTPIKALSITKDEIVKFLDGLPNQKIHCSIMGVEALRVAIYDWAEKRNVDLEKLGIKKEQKQNKKQDSSDFVVCDCMGHTKSYVIDQIKDLKLKTVEDVIDKIKTGSVCGKCIDKKDGIKDILKELNNKNKKEEEKTPYMLTKEIERTVHEKITPILAKDGGGIEIIEIKDKELFFKLKGTCKTCSSANNTIEYVIQKTLRDKVHKDIKVKQVL
jgi:NifU-like protein